MKQGNSLAFKFSPAFFLLLIGSSAAFACSGSGGVEIYMENAYMAKGYGHLSALFATGALYLQIRRSGWSKATMGLALLLSPLYFYPSGWHYSSNHGDCDSEEFSLAQQALISVGALFAWQLIAAWSFLRRQKIGIQN